MGLNHALFQNGVEVQFKVLDSSLNKIGFTADLSCCFFVIAYGADLVQQKIDLLMEELTLLGFPKV